MPTFISESITLQALNIDDGCAQIQIYANAITSSGNLIATISSSDMVAGYKVSGSNIYDDYSFVCLDSNGNKRTEQKLGNCDPGTLGEDIYNPGPQPCDDKYTYSGNKVFPAVYIVPLGNATGSVNVEYNAYSVPDKFTVEWDGNVVVNTGYVGRTTNQTRLSASLAEKGYDDEPITDLSSQFGGMAGFGSSSFDKTTEEPSYATVKVFGPLPGTAWNLTVNCPDDSSPVFDADTQYTASTTPSGGGSCLTGTTTATGVCLLGQNGTYIEEEFTLSEGNEATVRPAGTYYSGYGDYSGITSHPYNRSSYIGTANIVGGQQHAFLLKPNNEIVEWFVMAHDQGSSPGTSRFYPSSYKLTEAGTYKLRVYHLGCDNGNGTMGLYVDSCVEASNYETTRNTSVGSVTTGGAISSKFNVVWDTYQYQDAIDAQNLAKWISGRSSVSQNTWYLVDSSLITAGGFKIFDSTPTEEGDINLLSNSQVKYVNDGLQYFVQVKNVSGAGNFVSTFTTNDQHKFRKG